MKKFDFDYIKEFINKTTESTSIYVGCDSKVFREYTVFVSVIVVHLNSSNGCKIFYQQDRINRRLSLRERLLKEVDFAVYTALSIVDSIGNRKLEVHLDINPNENYKSSIIVKEAIGYVMAQGFKPVLKPESVAAYSVADYIVKNF
ncbi:MAG: ribonuclease H-like YkuK family protein [Hydrogenothermaceae bacterium]